MAAHDPLRWGENICTEAEGNPWQMFLTHSSGFLWGVEGTGEDTFEESAGTLLHLVF